MRHSQELVATPHEADFGTASFPARGTGPWLRPAPLPPRKASLHHPHPGLCPSLSQHIKPSPQGSSLPAKQKCLAQIFCSTSAQTQPFPRDGSAGRNQPHGLAGDTPMCPCPGSRSPCAGTQLAGWEAGACEQLQTQQQQPLLFHTSVFLALLCISVQELKLRSLAEVLSVVTALRAVVRHSLSLSPACSLPLSFFLPFFFSSPLPKVCSLDLLLVCGYAAAVMTRDQRWKIGSKAWPEPL